MDVGSPMGPDMPPMPPGGDMGGPPVDIPPMPPNELMAEPGMEPGETDLPSRAMVVAIEGNTVKLQTADGLVLDLPTSAFPVPPSEGTPLVKSVVLDVTEVGVVIGVGETQEPTEIPTNQLQDTFQVGEYVWMPEMPASPDMMMEDMGGMGGPPAGGMMY